MCVCVTIITKEKEVIILRGSRGRGLPVRDWEEQTKEENDKIVF